MKHTGDVRMRSRLEVVKALCTATKTPSGLLLWLKFESDALLFQDSSGQCQPTPRKEGRPLHCLTDRATTMRSLHYLWQIQYNTTESPMWEGREEESLLKRLKNSNRCWGCQFQKGKKF